MFFRETCPYDLMVFKCLVNQLTNSLSRRLLTKLRLVTVLDKFSKSIWAPSDVIMFYPNINSVKGVGIPDCIIIKRPFSTASSVSLFSVISSLLRNFRPNIRSQIKLKHSSSIEQFFRDRDLRFLDIQMNVANLIIDRSLKALSFSVKEWSFVLYWISMTGTGVTPPI